MDIQATTRERAPDSGHAGGEHHDEHGRIPIFIDDERHFAPKPEMTGAELKVLGEVPADYQLFLEVPGPEPDIGIRDDEVVELKPWDVIRVAPQVVRGFEAGPEGLEVIAVGGPKPEGGDGVTSDSPWPG
jgi:hypothetical protein